MTATRTNGTTGICTADISSRVADTSQQRRSTDAHLSLLFEHFGYNPRQYIESFIYKASESLDAHGEKLESKLTAVCDGNEEAAGGATYALLTLLDKTIDHIADILELYSMQHVFGITSTQAEHMVLPHHAQLNLRGTESYPEAQGLQEEQTALDAKVNAALAVQHALQLALRCAKRKAQKAQHVRAALQRVLGTGGDGKDAPAAAAAAAAAKILSDSTGIIAPLRGPLMDALDDVRKLDPLGAPLASHHKSSTSQGAQKEEQDSDAAAAAAQPWTQGREGYLRWQTRRQLSTHFPSLVSSDDVADAAADREDNAHTAATPSKKRQQTNPVTTPGQRARKAPRRSTALHDDVDGMDGDEVGQTTDMHLLAGLLRHGGSAAADGP